MKAVLLGNAGSGKSTLARRLIRNLMVHGAPSAPRDIALLSLDEIAWNPGAVRKPFAESLALLQAFTGKHAQWIIEGVYGDLVETLLPQCTELHFLNPGVDICVAHCKARHWEPDRFALQEEQDAILDNLIAWVRQYPTRDDECGLTRHRALFDAFTGKKREYTSANEYVELLPIRTARLTLRPLTLADTQAIFEIFSNPAVMRYWSTAPWTAMAQAEKKLASVLEGYESGEHFTYAIERNEDAQLIGTLSLFNFVMPSRRADIGYGLGEPYWGSGYMHEALSAWVRHAFETLSLHRLEADIDPRNEASARALERQGFLREGLLRERWIVGEEVSDTSLYGLLAHDWHARL